ncbi:DNA alkylation repair protein [Bacillus sp. V5-8f]|uniref:DNA alkylation repair protein n=1 Tax=Bacillus sp. V5-8f TaxID=2053044 RepID=UPI000C791AEE|nr:DNA alkylation repair protein [Bacillus sp. V5-8f]PLT34986.1 DNA alkylation repair protein [Bacillus sp. V5-8f]
MSVVYRCPNCKTNKSRFNLIQQVVIPVKKDPNTGEVLQQFTNEALDPFHLPYTGPNLRVQCGICGSIGEERTFSAFGAMNMR